MYTQATSSKVSDILKLKDNYSNLLAEKIENIHKIINNIDKTKLQIKMTTKKPSYKQVIVLMSKTNVDNFIASVTGHITNINRTLKNIKSKVIVDYIWPETTGIIIVSNAIATSSNLQVIKNYVKNVENIMLEDV